MTKKTKTMMKNVNIRNSVTPSPRRSLFLGWAHKNRKGKKNNRDGMGWDVRALAT